MAHSMVCSKFAACSRDRSQCSETPLLVFGHYQALRRLVSPFLLTERAEKPPVDCSAWDAVESGLSAMCVDEGVRDWLRHSPSIYIPANSCLRKAHAGTTECSSCD